MPMSDTLQIISMVAGALAFLAVQAGGLIVYWNRAITAIKDGFAKDLADHKTANSAAIELLHGRINNIRKEFVTGELYQRDLAEMKQVQREILGAINTLGTTMQASLAKLDKTDGIQEYRLNAIDDILNGRNVSRGSNASVGG